MVRRVYVWKKQGFDVEARALLHELRSILGIKGLTGLQLVNRYDVEGIEDELFEQCVPTVFSEPPVDDVAFDLPGEAGQTVFAVEYLPGQFDQRAESASECIQLISQGERPAVRSAKVYVLDGALAEDEVEAIKRYVINPVEAREADLAERSTLAMEVATPGAVEVIDGFRNYTTEALAAFIKVRGLAMDVADITFCQEYFRSEQRDPTITEIRVIDTYWSDHCRHTTFGTVLDEVSIGDRTVQMAFQRYLGLRDALGRAHKPVCLMDMGTIGARYLKHEGILTNLDESDEINACTVKVKVDVDGQDEDWLFLFKNETHNHPTEIEPFGGAATCVGGAIRDPLSGRSYVYQAMRVTGAADPTAPVSQTIPGKLPQRKLVTTAAAGYASYGNQIGLATGQVSELYHPGYVAKRMEVGAVLGATPADHVRREEPAPGDKIILLGGRTGRDGIGGATGSSKSHSVESIETCGAEVQKGNAPVERKLQRLFRRGEACRLIKRCNDFGAGGVSVAVGEIADGLHVDLNAVTKKYEGLDGTELAIAESQERMAVAVAAPDVAEFLSYAREENLEAAVIATVTEQKRMVMEWNGDVIVDMSREFLNSNGAAKKASALINPQQPWAPFWYGEGFEQRLKSMLTDLNVASSKGLGERFDSTIGAATVLMPFGGATQLTPSQAMVAKFPVMGETTTVSGMSWGFNPYLSEKNQYQGAYDAVVESVSKLIATGFSRKAAYLSFQEYFPKLGNDPERWGMPVASVLGGLSAQLDLGVGSIGGKDSMSGSFEHLDVPPTLISFAVSTGHVDRVISPEFKASGSPVFLISPRYTDNGVTATPESILAAMDTVEDLTSRGAITAAWTAGFGGIAEGIFKMCVGNRLGFSLDPAIDPNALLNPAYGSFIVELAEDARAIQCADADVTRLGATTADYQLVTREGAIDLAHMQELWEKTIEGVFPYRQDGKSVEALSAPAKPSERPVPSLKFARPRVVIPVFPGTNCEYDTARAFERVGADPTVFVVNNLTPKAVAASAAELVKLINQSQIVMLPGGFSGGDEPDGSAKFIASFFRAPAVTEAVRDLLQARDGLMLGICNGFQALIKLGLVTTGDIVPIGADAPTLTFNTIGRHQSRLVRTRIASNLSPWLSKCEVGDIHTVAISHGEGRFVAGDDALRQLIAKGQVATQYVDASGVPGMAWDVNPNGSVMAIEGITSPDGRVFGKMGHSERSGAGLYKNVPGNLYQPIFEGGVEYFK